MGNFKKVLNTKKIISLVLSNLLLFTEILYSCPLFEDSLRVPVNNKKTYERIELLNRTHGSGSTLESPTKASIPEHSQIIQQIEDNALFTYLELLNRYRKGDKVNSEAEAQINRIFVENFIERIYSHKLITQEERCQFIVKNLRKELDFNIAGYSILYWHKVCIDKVSRFESLVQQAMKANFLANPDIALELYQNSLSALEGLHSAKEIYQFYGLPYYKVELQIKGKIRYLTQWLGERCEGKVPKIALVSFSNVWGVPLSIGSETLLGQIQKNFKDRVDVDNYVIRSEEDIAQFIRQANERGYSLVSVSGYGYTHDIVDKLLSKIEQNPIVSTPRIVLGGHLAFDNAEIILKQHPDIDLCYGEGEPGIIDIVKGLLGEKVAVERNIRHGIKENAPAKFAMLDPSEITPSHFYAIEKLWLGGEVSVEASRSCDNACRWCNVRVFRRGVWRGRPISDIVNEIMLLSSWGVDTIIFADEDFGGGGSHRTTKLAEAILDARKKGLIAQETIFLISLRVTHIWSKSESKSRDESNKLRRKAWEVFYQAGGRRAFVGGETWSGKMLDRFVKNATPEENTNGCNILEQIGYYVDSGGIQIDPWSNIDEQIEHVEGLENSKQAKNIQYHGNPVLLQPNTAYTKRARKEGLLTGEYDTGQHSFGYVFKDADIQKIHDMMQRWKKVVAMPGKELQRLTYQYTFLLSPREFQDLITKHIKTINEIWFKYYATVVRGVAAGKNETEIEKDLVKVAEIMHAQFLDIMHDIEARKFGAESSRLLQLYDVCAMTTQKIEKEYFQNSGAVSEKIFVEQIRMPDRDENAYILMKGNKIYYQVGISQYEISPLEFSPLIQRILEVNSENSRQGIVHIIVEDKYLFDLKGTQPIIEKLEELEWITDDRYQPVHETRDSLQNLIRVSRSAAAFGNSRGSGPAPSYIIFNGHSAVPCQTVSASSASFFWSQDRVFPGEIKQCIDNGISKDVIIQTVAQANSSIIMGTAEALKEVPHRIIHGRFEDLIGMVWHYTSVFDEYNLTYTCIAYPVDQRETYQVILLAHTDGAPNLDIERRLLNIDRVYEDSAILSQMPAENQKALGYLLGKDWQNSGIFNPEFQQHIENIRLNWIKREPKEFRAWDKNHNSPFYNRLYWLQLWNCRLRCAHCWLATNPEKMSWATKDVLKLLQEAERLGYKHVKTAGGEATLINIEDLKQITHAVESSPLEWDPTEAFISDGLLPFDKLNDAVKYWSSLDIKDPAFYISFTSLDKFHFRAYSRKKRDYSDRIALNALASVRCFGKAIIFNDGVKYYSLEMLNAISKVAGDNGIELRKLRIKGSGKITKLEWPGVGTIEVIDRAWPVDFYGSALFLDPREWRYRHSMSELGIKTPQALKKASRYLNSCRNPQLELAPDGSFSGRIEWWFFWRYGRFPEMSLEELRRVYEADPLSAWQHERDLDELLRWVNEVAPEEAEGLLKESLSGENLLHYLLLSPRRRLYLTLCAYQEIAASDRYLEINNVVPELDFNIATKQELWDFAERLIQNAYVAQHSRPNTLLGIYSPSYRKVIHSKTELPAEKELVKAFIHKRSANDLLLRKVEGRRDCGLIYLKGGRVGGLHPVVKNDLLKWLDKWFVCKEGKIKPSSFAETIDRWNDDYFYWHFLYEISHNPVFDISFVQELAEALEDRNEAAFRRWMEQATEIAGTDEYFARQKLMVDNYFLNEGQYIFIKFKEGVTVKTFLEDLGLTDRDALIEAVGKEMVEMWEAEADKSGVELFEYISEYLPMATIIEKFLVGTPFAYNAFRFALRRIIAGHEQKGVLKPFMQEVLKTKSRIYDPKFGNEEEFTSGIFNGVHSPSYFLGEMETEYKLLPAEDVDIFMKFLQEEEKIENLIIREIVSPLDAAIIAFCADIERLNPEIKAGEAHSLVSGNWNLVKKIETIIKSRGIPQWHPMKEWQDIDSYKWRIHLFNLAQKAYGEDLSQCEIHPALALSILFAAFLGDDFKKLDTERPIKLNDVDQPGNTAKSFMYFKYNLLTGESKNILFVVNSGPSLMVDKIQLEMLKEIYPSSKITCTSLYGVFEWIPNVREDVTLEIVAPRIGSKPVALSFAKELGKLFRLLPLTESEKYLIVGFPDKNGVLIPHDYGRLAVDIENEYALSPLTKMVQSNMNYLFAIEGYYKDYFRKEILPLLASIPIWAEERQIVIEAFEEGIRESDRLLKDSLAEKLQLFKDFLLPETSKIEICYKETVAFSPDVLLSSIDDIVSKYQEDELNNRQDPRRIVITDIGLFPKILREQFLPLKKDDCPKDMNGGYIQATPAKTLELLEAYYHTGKQLTRDNAESERLESAYLWFQEHLKDGQFPEDFSGLNTCLGLEDYIGAGMSVEMVNSSKDYPSIVNNFLFDGLKDPGQKDDNFIIALARDGCYFGQSRIYGGWIAGEESNVGLIFQAGFKNFNIDNGEEVNKILADIKEEIDTYSSSLSQDKKSEIVLSRFEEEIVMRLKDNQSQFYINAFNYFTQMKAAGVFNKKRGKVIFLDTAGAGKTALYSKIVFDYFSDKKIPSMALYAVQLNHQQNDWLVDYCPSIPSLMKEKIAWYRDDKKAAVWFTELGSHFVLGYYDGKHPDPQQLCSSLSYESKVNPFTVSETPEGNYVLHLAEPAYQLCHLYRAILNWNAQISYRDKKIHKERLRVALGEVYEGVVFDFDKVFAEDGIVDPAEFARMIELCQHGKPVAMITGRTTLGNGIEENFVRLVRKAVRGQMEVLQNVHVYSYHGAVGYNVAKGHEVPYYRREFPESTKNILESLITEELSKDNLLDKVWHSQYIIYVLLTEQGKRDIVAVVKRLERLFKERNQACKVCITADYIEIIPAEAGKGIALQDFVMRTGIAIDKLAKFDDQGQEHGSGHDMLVGKASFSAWLYDMGTEQIALPLAIGLSQVDAVRYVFNRLQFAGIRPSIQRRIDELSNAMTINVSSDNLYSMLRDVLKDYPDLGEQIGVHIAEYLNSYFRAGQCAEMGIRNVFEDLSNLMVLRYMVDRISGKADYIGEIEEIKEFSSLSENKILGLYKTEERRRHVLRVAKLTAMLLQLRGYSENEIRIAYDACLAHDIGGEFTPQETKELEQIVNFCWSNGIPHRDFFLIEDIKKKQHENITQTQLDTLDLELFHRIKQAGYGITTQNESLIRTVLKKRMYHEKNSWDIIKDRSQEFNFFNISPEEVYYMIAYHSLPGTLPETISAVTKEKVMSIKAADATDANNIFTGRKTRFPIGPCLTDTFISLYRHLDDGDISPEIFNVIIQLLFRNNMLHKRLLEAHTPLNADGVIKEFPWYDKNLIEKMNKYVFSDTAREQVLNQDSQENIEHEFQKIEGYREVVATSI